MKHTHKVYCSNGNGYAFSFHFYNLEKAEICAAEQRAKGYFVSVFAIPHKIKIPCQRGKGRAELSL